MFPIASAPTTTSNYFMTQVGNVHTLLMHCFILRNPPRLSYISIYSEPNFAGKPNSYSYSFVVVFLFDLCTMHLPHVNMTCEEGVFRSVSHCFIVSGREKRIEVSLIEKDVRNKKCHWLNKKKHQLESIRVNGNCVVLVRDKFNKPNCDNVVDDRRISHDMNVRFMPTMALKLCN